PTDLDNRELHILTQSPPHQGARRAVRFGMVVTAASLFAVVTAFGTVPDSPAPLVLSPIDQTLTPQLESLASPASSQYVQEDRYQRGDTIASLLNRLGVDEDETRRLMATTQAADPLRRLRPGTAVQATTSENGDLLGLWFLGPRDQMVSIEPSG